MARKLERRWRDLKQKAKQLDDFDRIGALASAVSAIEVALTAAGTPRQDREGVQARLRRCTALANRTSVPDQINIMAAIDARNKAIHGHVVPNPDDCERHLLVLHKVWRELRRSFVTRQQAAALAESILQIPNEVISAVFLFGSLARGKRDPRDIDLLVLDKGQFSYLATEYRDLDFVLSDESVDTPANRAANQCGWLDLVFIDGSRVGADRNYTLSFSKSHDDPLFLINISDGLLKYQPNTNRWVEDRPQVFQRLAMLRQQLETENIVAAQ